VAYNALLKKYRKLIGLINTYQLENHNFKIMIYVKVLYIQSNGQSLIEEEDVFLMIKSSIKIKLNL
jgi:hypothetical protein